MNEIANKFLLVRDKFNHEVHLRKPGFTCSACESFTKNKERIKKCTEIVDSQYFYQNELDKACFQHDMAYGEFKDLPRRNAFDKLFPDKAFNIAKIQIMMDMNVFSSMIYNFFYKSLLVRIF